MEKIKSKRSKRIREHESCIISRSIMIMKYHEQKKRVEFLEDQGLLL